LRDSGLPELRLHAFEQGGHCGSVVEVGAAFVGHVAGADGGDGRVVAVALQDFELAQVSLDPSD
jgi:hypothetical protein